MIRWASLRFPFLPVERSSRAHDASSPAPPLVLTARRGAREEVVAFSEELAGLGLRPGMTAVAARALHTDVEIRRHDSEDDRRTLEGLAAVFVRYTPDVFLDGEGLLLEIGRTAKLFGGEDALISGARTLGRRLGYTIRCGVADVPAAARALARAAPPSRSHAPGSSLEEALAPLPIGALAPSLDEAEACRLLGLDRLGDLFALPRQGLAARLGDALVRRLDAVLDERSEVLDRFRPRPSFHEKIEWWPPTDDRGRLAFAAKRLFDQAEELLAIRERGILRVELTLGAPDRAVADRSLSLSSSRRTRSSEVFCRLLQHRLERETLRAPIDRLELRLGDAAPLKLTQLGLFDDQTEPTWNGKAFGLYDRLVGRLGEQRVCAFSLCSDHRPERAWHWHAPDPDAPVGLAPAPGRRPLELDEPPLQIAVETDSTDRPVVLRQEGRALPLQALRGPERVESGWWDGDDIRRRYFEVETEDGVRLWIFEDLRTGHWLRHGLFS